MRPTADAPCPVEKTALGAQLGIRKEIMNRFRNFMRTYTNEKGEAIFQMKIKDMCLKNRSSFEVLT